MDKTYKIKNFAKWLGLITGPLLAILIYSYLPSSYTDGGGTLISFSSAARATAALAAWMAVWWMTEAIELYATALLPLVVLPLTDSVPLQAASAPYAHELIFLFLGGFFLALAMERWGLHRRIAIRALMTVGGRPLGIIACCMGVTAFLSMWVSNTATTIMMIPIAVSIIKMVESNKTDLNRKELNGKSISNFSVALLLSIAYAASIGGIGTIIGTPPNIFLVSFIKDTYDLEISFVRWMGLGVPLVVIFIPITWFILTKVIYPIRNLEIGIGIKSKDSTLKLIGPISRGEVMTLAVFLLTAGAWITRPILNGIHFGDIQPFAKLTDSVIAMSAGLMLFILPVELKRRIFVLDWNTAVKTPWGVLLLFGGGLSLANAIRINGVDEFIGNQLIGLGGIPTFWLVVLVIGLVIFLTEMTSNTATTATFIPILAALSTGFNMHPFMLIVPAAMAASCAFMLPVATPPNSIIFGSGYVTIQKMIRAGLFLNFIGMALITLLTYTIMLWILGN